MKKLVIITDLTRMKEKRVCIAGYDENGNCIRPVLPPPGIKENKLYLRGSHVISPFSVVEFDLLKHLPQPPHTEDYLYNPKSIRFIKHLDEKRKREILTKTLFENVSAIFEVPVLSDPGHYIIDGQGPRSLGTIQPRRVIKAIHEKSPEGMCKYRLNFIDGQGKSYRLTITDLTWRYYNDRLRDEGKTPQQISSDLTATLMKSEVFLRIGLARGWEKFPDRCFLQITGVYSFPDYLKGQTFSDLAPKQNKYIKYLKSVLREICQLTTH